MEEGKEEVNACFQFMVFIVFIVFWYIVLIKVSQNEYSIWNKNK